jgi:hypothetical protein|tara:strand:+ start:2006 stop:2218 length:213 start_codon:yes stop_codon:yes gene_type:complete
MPEDPSRKNEMDILELRGEIKLLDQKLDTIKDNDLRHLQKAVDGITKVLWGVGILVLGQLAVGVRLALFG